MPKTYAEYTKECATKKIKPVPEAEWGKKNKMSIRSAKGAIKKRQQQMQEVMGE